MAPSRRAFLAAVGATGLVLLPGCGGGGSAPAPGPDPTPVAQGVAYRLSTRGRRASRAAKAHAANKRFRTRAAAEASRAHPGDNSRVVAIDVSRERWLAWFGDGSATVDLRRI